MKRSAYGLASPGFEFRSWELDGLCGKEGDPEWWSITEVRVNRLNQRAIRICGRCPVRRECDEKTDPRLHWGTIRAGVPVAWSPKQSRAPRGGLAECGTRKGYLHHLNLNEEACPACRAANNEAARASKYRRALSDTGEGR